MSGSKPRFRGSERWRKHGHEGDRMTVRSVPFTSLTLFVTFHSLYYYEENTSDWSEGQAVV